MLRPAAPGGMEDDLRDEALKLGGHLNVRVKACLVLSKPLQCVLEHFDSCGWVRVFVKIVIPRGYNSQRRLNTFANPDGSCVFSVSTNLPWFCCQCYQEWGGLYGSADCSPWSKKPILGIPGRSLKAIDAECMHQLPNCWSSRYSWCCMQLMQAVDAFDHLLS